MSGDFNQRWWNKFKSDLQIASSSKFYLKPDLKQVLQMEVDFNGNYYAMLTNFHPLHEETGDIFKKAKKEVVMRNGF